MIKKTLLTIAALLTGIAAEAQWSADPAVNNRITLKNTDNYSREVETTKDGLSYVVSIIPNGYDENQRALLDYRVNIIAKDGTAITPEEGIRVSCEPTRSYTVVNETAILGNDDNLLVITSDSRNAESTSSDLGYNVYKIGRDGSLLWDKPAELWDGEVFNGAACITGTQTVDGSYIFAWCTFSMTEDTPMKIHIEKISSEGKSVWKQVMEDAITPYSYPYIVDAGDNQVIMVFMQGSNQNLMARMIDFDGSSVWAQDTKIYQGGFDQTPPWTYVSVEKAPNGGCFVTWRDDRLYEGVFSNYISYVKNDGTLGFPGGVNALKISHADEYSRMNPKIYTDEENNCIYAVYRQFNQGSQQNQGIFMQKIGLDGELIWGAEGKAVIDIQSIRSLGYATVQSAGGSDIAVFYMDNNIAGNDVHTFYMKYDKDGNPLMDEPFNFTTTTSNRSGLLSSKLIDGSYWILNWEDFRDSSSQNMRSSLYMQRVNVDGSLGNPADGIDNTVKDIQPAETILYSIDGRRVDKAGKGIYIVKNVKDGTTQKVLMK